MNSSFNYFQEIGNYDSSTRVALILTPEEIKNESSLRYLTENKEFINDLNSSSFQWVYHEEFKTKFLLAQLKNFENDNNISINSRKLGALILEQLVSKKSKKVELIISNHLDKEIVGIFINSFILSNWHYNLKQDNIKDKIYSSIDTHRKIGDFNFKYNNKKEFSDDKELNLWIELAESTLYARTLSNTRGGIAKPSYMEDKVRELIKDHPEVRNIIVIKGKELEQIGMNLFYGVGKGANDEPRCIIVEYIGNDENNSVDYAFVGKGITFDTGGLNIKGTGSMEDMYLDKAGACNVLGTLRGTLRLKIKKNIIFAMAFAENSVDNNSLIPKDILISLKGLTVEIGNTDAEGRLVLADTMTYVQQNYKPKYLIDIATLTGAIRIALGNETAGLFTNNNEFAKNYLLSSKYVFEPTWLMPITDEARDNMKGKNSDLSNLGSSSFGSAIKAAAFLEKFVEKGTNWIHLDIAGSDLHMSPKLPICSGSNGSGTQSFIYHLYKN